VSTPEVPEYLAVAPKDPSFQLRGEVVATSPYGVAVMKVERPLQARWRLEGATFDGAPAGASRRMELRVYEPSRRVALTLSADPVPPGTVDALRYEIEDEDGPRRGTLAPGSTRRVVVAGDRATIRLPSARLPDGAEVTIRVAAIEPVEAR
jgi:hypothetical protein